MSIPMVSIAKHVYHGKVLHANDPFEAKTERDAEDLEVLNFARRLPRAVATPKPYERRDMRVGETAATGAESLAAETRPPETSAPSSDSAEASPNPDAAAEPEQDEATRRLSSEARRSRYGRRDLNAKR